MALPKIVLVFPNTLNREAFPPMGIAFLASALHARGIPVEIIDLNFDPGLDTYRERLRAGRPDMVGFSFTSPMAKSAGRCIDICRQEFPGAAIIAGGPHPTIMPKETMGNPAIDYVVVGEGEETLVDLVKTVSEGGDAGRVHGICYRTKAGQIVQTPARGFIEDLDSLPALNWNLIPDIDQYLHYSDYSLPIMVSRGCPGKCSFCQPTVNKLFGKKVRYRSADKAVQELLDLKQAKRLKSFLFQDDTFTWRKSWVRDFCRLSREKGLGLKWACNSRVDTINEDMLRDMRDAGVYKIAFGVESGSQRVLDEIMTKGTKIQQVVDIFDLCRKHGILANAFIMLGSPNETREDVEQTIRLLQRIKPNWVSCTRAVLLPHTHLYDYAARHGLSLLEDAYLENLHYADFRSVTHRINFTDSEMRRLKNKLYRKWALATIKERTILKTGLIFLTLLGTLSPPLARLAGKGLSRIIWVPPPVYS